MIDSERAVGGLHCTVQACIVLARNVHCNDLRVRRCRHRHTRHRAHHASTFAHFSENS